MVCAPAASGPPSAALPLPIDGNRGLECALHLGGAGPVAGMARTRRPGLPVLYITGYSDNAEHVADESTVLLKPVPEEALLATVARMLGTLC
jgi:hypothetical protein